MKFFAILLLSLFSSSVFSKGGDEVRNGGGLAENYLIYALGNLDHSIDLCLMQKECGARNNGRVLLSQIKESLTQERRNNILRFSSNAEKPGYFIINGVVRLAVTGERVGDPIYYNLDLLYKGSTVVMGHGLATQSLIHELGHHHGVTDHDFLDFLGAEVRGAMDGVVSEVSFLPHLGKESFLALGSKSTSSGPASALVLSFKNKLVDLTPYFSFPENACENQEENAGFFRERTINVFNLHWIHELKALNSKDKTLSGNIVLHCKNTTGFSIVRYYEFVINVEVRNTVRSFEYVSSRLLRLTPKYLYKI